MRRLLVVLGVAGIAVLGGYLFLHKRSEVVALYDSASGYPAAKTPQECVDLFKKAIKDRNYERAAKYCTPEYAEQLTRSATAAAALGKSIDGLTSRMNDDGVMTSEMELVLFYNDPFPPTMTMTVQTTGDKEATASLGVVEPRLQSAIPTSWDYDPYFVKGLYAYQPGIVNLVKEKEGWKIHFPVPPAQRDQVDRVISNHRDYVNAFKKMSEEIRIERTTKAEVEKRLRELLKDAVGAKK
jgi:hypothetical protein